MKINIISDIHASFDAKTNKVVYNNIDTRPEYKFEDAIRCLYEYWKANRSKLIDIDYSYKNLNKYERKANTELLKSYDGCVNFLGNLIDIMDNGFNSLTQENVNSYVDNLHSIRKIMLCNGLTNHNTHKIRCDDIVDWLYKKVCDFDPSRLEPADYLIIAGDLGLDNFYDEVVKDIEENTKGKFKKILHIAGNHDHWWIGTPSLNETRPEDVNLEHDYCEHVDGDYVFLGCTMWTPIPEKDIWTVGRCMNDYRYIPGRFNCYRSSKQFEIQTTWLRNKLDIHKDKKVIVFTHHQPFEELTADDYKHNGKGWDVENVNSAYVVTDHSLDDINEHGNIKLWCCGHTHQCYDGMLHNVHVVRNPIGYRDHYGYIPAENMSGTWYNKIVEV